MRVLIVSPTQTGIGGIAQHVSGLVGYLRNYNHLVDVISSENTFTIPIKGLKNPSFMVSSYLKTKFKKNYDIVHAHNMPAALAMKSMSAKKVLTLHGVFSRQVGELHGSMSGALSGRYEKDALKWANAITVISKEAYDFYTNLGYKVRQVPNAIDVNGLAQGQDRRFEKQIIFAGRLSREKGTDALAVIAQSIPKDAHLVIVGAGPEEQRMRDLEKNHANVHFLGYLPKEKTIQLIRGSDILVQPSLAEGISSSILEAMACGTAIITSNVGGNKELIEDGRTGFLLDPKDPKQFISKIAEIIYDVDLLKHVADGAMIAASAYDWSRVGKLYLDIYESVLD